MESRVQQISRSACAVIGAEGATNFGIARGHDGGTGKEHKPISHGEVI
jgi:hypothetical protein